MPAKPASAAAKAASRAKLKGSFGRPGPATPPRKPEPPEPGPLAAPVWTDAPWPGLATIPREGPGWWFVGKCDSLPVNAWAVLRAILCELAAHCPGGPGADPRAVILDASALGCTGHPAGYHARNDVDLAYFTRGPTNLTQPAQGAVGRLAVTSIWQGNALDLAVLDARRTYWLWRGLHEAFRGRVITQMDEEIASALRTWARANLPAGAPLPGEGDPAGLRSIYAHHQHMHVGITEVTREGVDWGWFTPESQARRARECGPGISLQTGNRT